MPDPRLDVLCIGNAIVDVIATRPTSSSRRRVTKDSMRAGPMRKSGAPLRPHAAGAQVSGGCAGNTAAGIAALGGRAGFVGQVAPDQLGTFYRHDLTAAGVEFTTPPGTSESDRASMILVTPDGHGR